MATGRQPSAPPFARPVLALAAASGYALDACWRAQSLVRRALSFRPRSLLSFRPRRVLSFRPRGVLSFRR